MLCSKLPLAIGRARTLHHVPILASGLGRAKPLVLDRSGLLTCYSSRSYSQDVASKPSESILKDFKDTRTIYDE